MPGSRMRESGVSRPSRASVDMRLPIKLDSTSNGEFEPVALPAPALEARQLARETVDTAARRVGLNRRRYLVSALGAAATLAAFNRAFAAAGQRGGHYALPREAPYELAAAEAAVGGEEFIFDVQLHHVNPQGAWRRGRVERGGTAARGEAAGGRAQGRRRGRVEGHAERRLRGVGWGGML